MKYIFRSAVCGCILTAGLSCAVFDVNAQSLDGDSAGIQGNVEIMRQAGDVMKMMEQIKQTAVDAAAYADKAVSEGNDALADAGEPSRDADDTSAGADGALDGSGKAVFEAGIQVFLAQRGTFTDALTDADTGRDPGTYVSGTGMGMTETVLEEESEYADLAIADVTNYVNVRKEPNTDSEIVGKIYSGAVAHVLAEAGEENDWFRIISGNVEGYIKAEFFIYGDAAVAGIDNYVTRYATVIADRLNVRVEPDITAKRIGYLDNGERVKILENNGDWLKVQYTEDAAGFVAAEYVTIAEEFVYAKTLEEEAKELAEKKALEARSKISDKQASENTSITVNPPNTVYSTNEELRSQIVEYAMQYLGNKYVHGGQSLKSGTDCSGFTSLIYAEFGYSVSRTPAGQLSGSGRSIDYSEIQPGDIICYGSSGKCTHVALYIGDGKIIHAANSRKGVITGNANYDTILGVKNIID